MTSAAETVSRAGAIGLGPMRIGGLPAPSVRSIHGATFVPVRTDTMVRELGAGAGGVMTPGGTTSRYQMTTGTADDKCDNAIDVYIAPGTDLYTVGNQLYMICNDVTLFTGTGTRQTIASIELATTITHSLFAKAPNGGKFLAGAAYPANIAFVRSDDPSCIDTLAAAKAFRATWSKIGPINNVNTLTEYKRDYPRNGMRHNLAVVAKGTWFCRDYWPPTYVAGDDMYIVIVYCTEDEMKNAMGNAPPNPDGPDADESKPTIRYFAVAIVAEGHEPVEDAVQRELGKHATFVGKYCVAYRCGFAKMHRQQRPDKTLTKTANVLHPTPLDRQLMEMHTSCNATGYIVQIRAA